MLPREIDGRDSIELGCGTGYVSAGLARRGARPVGIDNSEAQLASARSFQQEFGLDFPLLHGNAEQVPYPDASFDIAISEYGASIWCDPYRWIPEAARLLRPGGELVFLVGSVLLTLCGRDDGNGPAGEELLRPLFGMHQVEWPDEPSIEFHLPQGKMIDLLRDCGFTVEQLIEVRPPADATTRYTHVALDWAPPLPGRGSLARPQTRGDKRRLARSRLSPRVPSGAWLLTAPSLRVLPPPDARGCFLMGASGSTSALS